MNSIHHQAIKKLGKGLVIEARSMKDEIIEAIRHEAEEFVYAVQWHPEFHEGHDFLDCRPLLQEFLKAAKKGKK